MHFAHPSSWEDPYETRLLHKQGQFIYGLCWCKLGVSDAMWRIYSPSTLGVRIRTTRERLGAALRDEQDKQPDFRWHLQDVRYVFQDDLESKLGAIAASLGERYRFKDAVAPLFLKRRAFKHEHEVRAAVFAPKSGASATSFRLKVTARWLIDSVLVDPRAPNAYVEAYRYYLKGKLKFPGTVGKSVLYAPGVSIAAGTDATAELKGLEIATGQGTRDAD